uniref:Uncharacterized protein n=1 Tax=Cacopsylla melanoneura TaxID=428564 RepID=A0A8D8SAU9_9HEMI
MGFFRIINYIQLLISQVQLGVRSFRLPRSSTVSAVRTSRSLYPSLFLPHFFSLIISMILIIIHFPRIHILVIFFSTLIIRPVPFIVIIVRLFTSVRIFSLGKHLPTIPVIT